MRLGREREREVVCERKRNGATLRERLAAVGRTLAWKSKAGNDLPMYTN